MVDKNLFDWFFSLNHLYRAGIEICGVAGITGIIVGSIKFNNYLKARKAKSAAFGYTPLSNENERREEVTPDEEDKIYSIDDAIAADETVRFKAAVLSYQITPTGYSGAFQDAKGTIAPFFVDQDAFGNSTFAFISLILKDSKETKKEMDLYGEWYPQPPNFEISQIKYPLVLEGKEFPFDSQEE